MTLWKALKIRSIEIQNYKCFRKTTLSISSNFHTIIGSNSSGKTSLFDACKLVRSIGNQINGTGILYTGVTESSDRDLIRVTFIVELVEKERIHYFSKYFQLSSEIIEEIARTKLLNKFKMTLGIRISAVADSKDYRVELIELHISDTRNDFVQVLGLEEDGTKLFFLQIESGIKVQIANDRTMDELLRNLNRASSNILPPGTFQFDLTQGFIASLRFIPSHRETVKEVNSKNYRDLSESDETGSDLISLMHFMFLNERDEFNKIEHICKRLFPDIERIHPIITAKDTYTVSIKKWNSPNEIRITHEGVGIDQLLIMIWLIATSKQGSIFFIDEPELHLHPGGQKLLYDFLTEQAGKDKQIFVTSHSMVFIHKSNLDQVTLLVYYEKGTHNFLLQDLVEAETLNTSIGISKIRENLYKALGYDPVFAFEPQKVVVVEGRTDENVITSFSSTLSLPVDPKTTYFLVVGNKQDVKNFSPIIAFALSNKKCLIILDNDKSRPEDVKNSVLNIEKNYRMKIKSDSPLLTDENFYSFPENVYSIEYYLLEPGAISRAFSCNDDKITTEIREEINIKLPDINNKIMKPKNVLKDICEHHFQKYHDVESPSKIAECISRNHLLQYPELKELVELIAKGS